MSGTIGYISFPGIQGIVRATFTLGHGVAPGICNLDCAPQFGLATNVGALTIAYGGTRLVFPDCAVDDASIRYSPDAIIVGLRILDRRWRWQYGQISGWYNRRKPDGTLDTTTEKTPQQLADLCLKAMGESTHVVAEMPNLDRPEVVWDVANPALALQELCEIVGCRIVYGIDDRVFIRLSGVGAILPVFQTRHASYGVKLANLPEKIRVVCGPTLFQARFALEAVGKDTDGTVKAIDSLSYKPTNGWEKQHPPDFPALKVDSNVSSATASQRTQLLLAQETVFRWYRVKGVAESSSNANWNFPSLVEGYGKTVRKWQVLPILGHLVDYYTDPVDGEYRPREAFVTGTWYPPDAILQANVAVDTKSGLDFSIGANGIVVFNQPVYKKTGTNNDKNVAEADIQLETAFHVLDDETRMPERHTHEVSVPGARRGSGVRILRRDEIVRVVKHTYNSEGRLTGHTDNNEQVRREAEYHLAAALAEYTATDATSMEYAGFLPMNLDGAIQQVEWSYDASGFVTRASRNSETSLRVLSYRRATELRKAEKRSTIDRAVARSSRRLPREGVKAQNVP